MCPIVMSEWQKKNKNFRKVTDKKRSGNEVMKLDEKKREKQVQRKMNKS